MIELLAAFSLAVANGGNDIANAMGTSVGAGALSLKQALGFGSAFEFMGAILLGAMVSKTISKGVIEPREFEDNPGLFATVMFAVVSGASLTTLLATIYGIYQLKVVENLYPISATHGIIGGLVAVGWASKGVNCVGKTEHDVYCRPRIWQWFCYNGGNGIRGNADDDGDGGDEEEERFHNIILKAAKRNYLTVPSSSSAITISSYKGGRHHNDHDDVSAAAANSDDYHHIRCYHQDNVKKSQIIKQQQQQQQQRKDVIITPLADHTGLLIDEEDDGYDVANDATTTTTSTISTSSSTTNTNCSCEGASKREIIMEITTTTIGSENEEEEEDEEDLKTPLQDHQAKIKNNNEEEFVSLLVLSALTVAFAHGANDVGNAVGPLAAMLEVLTDGVVHEVPTVPMWALVLGAVGFVVGILTLGQNTIDTHISSPLSEYKSPILV
eukprot:jgi/Bigna1/138056/aug1.42_g12764